jgi:hypothetical protein
LPVATPSPVAASPVAAPRVTAAAAPLAASGGGGHPLLARGVLGLGALLMLWLVMPRRLLRRVLSSS